MLISSLFWGLLSSFLAGRQKRNAYLWFLIGSLFGAIGMGFLFFSRKKTAPAPPKPALSTEPEPLIYWYYLIGASRNGPMTTAALKKLFTEDKISEETYLWNENMNDWAKLKDLPIFSNL